MIRLLLIRLFNVIEILLLIRVILSWLPLGSNRFVEAIYMLTEPILEPIRVLLAKSMGNRRIMIDFSPLIAFILLAFIRNLVLNLVRI